MFYFGVGSHSIYSRMAVYTWGATGCNFCPVMMETRDGKMGGGKSLKNEKQAPQHFSLLLSQDIHRGRFIHVGNQRGAVEL